MAKWINVTISNIFFRNHDYIPNKIQKGTELSTVTELRILTAKLPLQGGQKEKDCRMEQTLCSPPALYVSST